MKRKIRNMNLVDFFHRNTSINKFNQEKLFYNIGKLYSTEKFLSESTVKPNEFSSNPNNIKLKNIENKDKFYLIFNERRTRRDFKKQKPLSFDIFSNIIKCSIGISSYEEMGKVEAPRFTYPTAGGFNSLMFYIIVSNVENVDAGVYLYNAYHNELISIKNNFKMNEFENITSATHLMENSYFTVYIVANLTYSSVKYGDRTYRFSNIEAGHVGQNLYLLCEYNNLSVVASGSFFDNSFFEYFKIDKHNKYLLYELVVGESND